MATPVTITRTTLHEQVWARRLREVARGYGLADIALARICRWWDIPVPPRWHWSGYGHGTAATLPLPSPGSPSEIVLTDLDTPHDRFGILRPRPPVPVITVATTVSDPHPLVVSTQQHLRAAVQVPDTVIHLPDLALLDLRVAGASLERGLRLLDALVKAAEARGHQVEVRSKSSTPIDRYGRPTEAGADWTSSVLRIDNASVPFSIVEEQSQVALPPDPPKRRRASAWAPPPQIRYRLEPTGSLSLHLMSAAGAEGIQCNWKDGIRQRLETCLHHVLTSAERLAATQECERLERERAAVAKAEAERRAAEAERRRQDEQRRIYDLMSRVRDWHTSASMRDFIAAVEADAVAARGTPIEPESDLARWLAWARHCADTLREQAIRTVLQVREPPQDRTAAPAYAESPQKTFWETRDWWNR